MDIETLYPEFLAFSVVKFMKSDLPGDPEKCSRLTKHQTIVFVLLLKYFQILKVYS